MIYDLAIVGAGPAGAMAAYKAAQLGLKTALLDAEQFPRHKVCGDAIPYETYKLLQSIEPHWHQQLLQNSSAQSIRYARIFTPNQKSISIEWYTKAVNQKRFDFDHWLLQNCLENQNIAFFQNFKVKTIKGHAGAFTLGNGNQNLETQFIIGAGGAHCPVARQLAQKRTLHHHHCGALRAYYENIEGLQANTNEIHILKNHIPGYLWIFPLPNNQANVGFGMLSSAIRKNQIDLKQAFAQALQSNELKDRFKNATLLHKIQGFDLPLGSAPPNTGGPGYLLAGDAASLIDPLDGHGIGAAMYAGHLAAQLAAQNLKGEISQAKMLSQYQQQLNKKFFKTFKQHHRLLRFAHYPFLLNLLTYKPLLKLSKLKIHD